MKRSRLASELMNEMNALRRFALLLTKSYEDAEDLAQDTMERAMLKAHLFDGANLRSWLFTMCRRVFLNDIRKKKSRGSAVDIDDAPQAAMGVEGNQEAAADFSHLNDCFDQLPKRDQDILSIVVLKGARYEEAAKELKVPVGTVRSRLFRARERLKHLFENGSHERGDMMPAA